MLFYFQQKVLVVYETNADGDRVASDTTVCYFCAATFSATVGRYCIYLEAFYFLPYHLLL